MSGDQKTPGYTHSFGKMSLIESQDEEGSEKGSSKGNTAHKLSELYHKSPPISK